MIDQFDKFQFSRLSSSILQKDFLLETNWVRDLQSSNFCSKTPRRLVGARATREGGVLLLKLISEIVTFLYSVRFSKHRISYELPSANYVHCSITDFPLNCTLWISFISSFFLLSHYSWGSCIYSVFRWSLPPLLFSKCDFLLELLADVIFRSGGILVIIHPFICMEDSLFA